VRLPCTDNRSPPVQTGPDAKAETLNVKNPWYALYTRSRHEKRVAETLEQRVRFRPEDASKVLSVPGSVQVIGVAGKPAPIPDDEMENVRLFTECLAETGVVPRPTPSIELGEQVLVQAGPFAGVRGVVLEHRGVDRVLIQIGLSAIGQALKIELDAESLEASAVGDEPSFTQNRRME